LPEAFGKWSSVYRQFRRWTLSGVWEVMLSALAELDPDAAVLQMIDSTTIRAHHCAAGAKGGLIARVLAVREVALRPKYTPTLTRMVTRSAC
jgi:transposase